MQKLFCEYCGEKLENECNCIKEARYEEDNRRFYEDDGVSPNAMYDDIMAMYLYER